MNNSLIALKSLEEEQEQTSKVYLNKKANELSQICEALRAVKSSNYWKLLEDRVFSGVLSNLQKRIRSEKDVQEIYRLQGQIVWAEKYLNLDGLAAAFRRELEIITTQINGKTNLRSTTNREE